MVPATWTRRRPATSRRPRRTSARSGSRGTTAARSRPTGRREYTFAETLPENGVSYAGSWTVQGERIVAGPDAKLRLRYWASNANLVLGTEGTPGTVEVLLDGKPVKTVTVREDDLYRLTDLPEAGEHLLELRFSPGVEAYAFTFG